MATLLAETRPRSRGKVRCDLCGHPIPAGVVYTQQSLADDGRAYTWRECPVCEDAAAGFMEANPADYWVDGYGTDTIDEWARDNPDDERAMAYLARRSGSTPDTGDELTPAEMDAATAAMAPLADAYADALAPDLMAALRDSLKQARAARAGSTPDTGEA